MEGLMLRQGAFWRLPEVRKVSGRRPPISGAICSLVPVLFAQPNPTQSALDQSFPDLSRMPLREMAFERRKTLTAWSIAANEATEETRRGSSKGPRSVQALNVNKVCAVFSRYPCVTRPPGDSSDRWFALNSARIARKLLPSTRWTILARGSSSLSPLPMDE